MKHITKYILIIAVALLWACEPSVDSFTPSSGSADFSKYVAVGDSYTAGYTDGALGLRGQESGFSNILAKQLGYVGGNGFHQPEVKQGSVGTTPMPDETKNGYLKLDTIGGSLSPVYTLGNMAIYADRLYDADKPFQNMGVPGAKSFHLLAPGYAQLNPFFARFASSTTTTILTDVMAADPSFVSLWIGGNDVLTYALEGGEADEITDPNMFAAYMSSLVSTVFTNGQKGVLGNVPSINDLPYFNHIQYNALVIDAETATLLNMAYAEYNQYAEKLGLDKMVFAEGSNAFVIADETHPLKMRQIKEGEKILLGASTGIQGEAGWGTKVPIPENNVLDSNEVKDIIDATEKYNQTILSISKDPSLDLAHVDLNGLMNDLSTNGLTIDGHTYTTTFVSGGVFSLDGIHATGKGSAIIANAFIDAINDKYNALVPRANVNDYDSVIFP